MELIFSVLSETIPNIFLNGVGNFAFFSSFVSVRSFSSFIRKKYIMKYTFFVLFSYWSLDIVPKIRVKLFRKSTLGIKGSSGADSLLP